MKINWKIRFKNVLFIGQIIAAIVVPLIVGVGLQWADMTSWKILGGTILKALGNPVVVISMVISLFNAIPDPTTSGVGDSVRALDYDTPHKDIVEEETGDNNEALG